METGLTHANGVIAVPERRFASLSSQKSDPVVTAFAHGDQWYANEIPLASFDVDTAVLAEQRRRVAGGGVSVDTEKQVRGS